VKECVIFGTEQKMVIYFPHDAQEQSEPQLPVLLLAL